MKRRTDIFPILVIGGAIAFGITAGLYFSKKMIKYGASFKSPLIEKAKQITAGEDGLLENRELASMLKELGYRGTVLENRVYDLAESDKPMVELNISEGFFGPDKYYFSLPKDKLAEYVRRYSKSSEIQK